MNIVIRKLSVKNPGVFVKAASLVVPLEDREYLVDDSMSESGLEDYVFIAQLCSVMSVFWLLGEVGVEYARLSLNKQREIAEVVIRNATPADQFEWAREKLGYRLCNSFGEVSNANPNADFAFYTARHVCAGRILGPDRVEIYDPETAEAEEYSLDDARILYFNHSSSYLYEWNG
ncbi:hypothetical protein [Luteimonas salinilitoris]|uniref:Uncharacterized protein n=1 Tax=Luteimonas salinilitoris TaxID=3237697 RepID=A0ABV4HPU3_9GAMM